MLSQHSDQKSFLRASVVWVSCVGWHNFYVKSSFDMKTNKGFNGERWLGLVMMDRDSPYINNRYPLYILTNYKFIWLSHFFNFLWVIWAILWFMSINLPSLTHISLIHFLKDRKKNILWIQWFSWIFYFKNLPKSVKKDDKKYLLFEI